MFNVCRCWLCRTDWWPTNWPLACTHTGKVSDEQRLMVHVFVRLFSVTHSKIFVELMGYPARCWLLSVLDLVSFWLAWKMWVHWMIRVRLASWFSVLAVCNKNFNAAIFLDTINMINVKLCMKVVFIELYSFIPLSGTWLYFKVTAVSNSFNWKFYVLIQLSGKFVWLLIT